MKSIGASALRRITPTLKKLVASFEAYRDNEYRLKRFQSNAPKTFTVPIKAHFNKDYYYYLNKAMSARLIDQNFSSGGSIQYLFEFQRKDMESAYRIYYVDDRFHVMFEEYRSPYFQFLKPKFEQFHPAEALSSYMHIVNREFAKYDEVQESDLVQKAKKLLSDYFDSIRSERKTFFSTVKQEKWRSQYELYNMVKLIYPDAEYQFRSAWLERQSLDIFIPSINTAIEYQGEQHYSAVPVFGGEENFKNNIARDKAKREKCADNGIRLIEWSHSERASVQNVLKELSCAGVENVPTVSDIGSMISEKNMKTVRKEIYEEYNNRVIIAK